MTLQAAAKVMRDEHTGDIVVTEDCGGRRRPIGIVTDRDIVVGVTAMGLDAAALTMADVMNAPLYTAQMDEDADVAIQEMRKRGIRRAPVVDREGYLHGIFTLDDYLEHLAKRLVMVNGLIKSERSHEELTRLALP
jgi:CBS domain-containing protein